MLKWVGRIFYVLFLFFLVSFLGNGSGLVQQSYYEKQVLGKINEPLVAVENFASMGSGYLQRKPVNGRVVGDDALAYEVITKNDKKLNLELLMYPLAVGNTETNDTGMFLTIDFKDEDINLEDYGLTSVSVVFYTEYKGASIVIDEHTEGSAYFSVYPTRPIISISNSQLINEPYTSENGYEVVGIQLFAYYLDSDQNVERYALLNLGKVSKDTSYDKTVIDDNFLITSDAFDISNVIGMSQEELTAAGIFHQSADFSAFNYWYWYTALIYFLFAALIPFFLFFRKPLMAKLAKRKLEKNNEKETKERIETLKKEALEKKNNASKDL